jgi:hypothetical protein
VAALLETGYVHQLTDTGPPAAVGSTGAGMGTSTGGAAPLEAGSGTAAVRGPLRTPLALARDRRDGWNNHLAAEAAEFDAWLAEAVPAAAWARRGPLVLARAARRAAQWVADAISDDTAASSALRAGAPAPAAAAAAPEICRLSQSGAQLHTSHGRAAARPAGGSMAAGGAGRSAALPGIVQTAVARAPQPRQLGALAASTVAAAGTGRGTPAPQRASAPRSVPHGTSASGIARVLPGLPSAGIVGLRMTARAGTQRGPPPGVAVTSHPLSRPAAAAAVMIDARTGSGGEAARVMDGPAARLAALRNTGGAGAHA